MRYLKTGLTVLFIICIVSCTSKRREMIQPELPLYSLDKGTYEDPDAFKGESIVEYCDNTSGDGSIYNTGDITFRIAQK